MYIIMLTFKLIYHTAFVMYSAISYHRCRFVAFLNYSILLIMFHGCKGKRMVTMKSQEAETHHINFMLLLDNIGMTETKC